MEGHFTFDERLKIFLPNLMEDWDEYSMVEQHEILYRWETIRGTIPDRIFELEEIINQKQAQLSDENDFPRSCVLNSEIAELASIINDLWIWYRIDQSVSGKDLD